MLLVAQLVYGSSGRPYELEHNEFELLLCEEKLRQPGPNPVYYKTFARQTYIKSIILCVLVNCILPYGVRLYNSKASKGKAAHSRIIINESVLNCIIKLGVI